MEPDKLAAGLLRGVHAPGPVTDLLFRTAGTNPYGTPAAGPSAALAKELVKTAGAENAETIIATIRDTTILDQIARKDSRKGIRRLIAANKRTSVDTQRFLLRWGLLKDHDTAAAVIIRGDVPADEIVDAVAKAAAAGSNQLAASTRHSATGLSPTVLVARVIAPADPDLLRKALTVAWPVFRNHLLSTLGQKPVDGFTVGDALEAVEPGARAGMLTELLEHSPTLTGELVDQTIELWPDPYQFPWKLFVTYSGEAVRGFRTITPEAVDRLRALAVTGDQRGQILLAAAVGVSADIRRQLIETGQRYLVQLIAGQPDLQPELVDGILDVSERWPITAEAYARGQMRNPMGNDGIAHPLWRLIGRSRPVDFTAEQAERLVTWVLQWDVRTALDRLWSSTADRISGDLRVRLIRRERSCDTTMKWLKGQLQPQPSADEFSALLNNPGEAFAYYRSLSAYSNRSEHVIPASPAEIITIIQRDGFTIASMAKTPWGTEVINRTRRPFETFGETVLPYLWEQLGPLQNSVAAIETLLVMAKDWENPLPDLVDTLWGLYSCTLDQVTAPSGQAALAPAA